MYRDEFDLAILRLQEENRLEILKRKWWEGGKCPKEEDHRAKGEVLIANLLSLCVLGFAWINLICICVCFLARTWHGEYRWDLCSPGLWPVNCYLHGGIGVCMDAASYSRNRGERGLFYLPLLCVLLPGHAPHFLSPFPCLKPCQALHLTAHTPQSLPHTGAFSPLAVPAPQVLPNGDLSSFYFWHEYI